MIVQCEKCETKFSLQDSLIKKEGSKVRCSLCKHIFMVYRPLQILEDEDDTIAIAHQLDRGMVHESPPQASMRGVELESAELEKPSPKMFETSPKDFEKTEDISAQVPRRHRVFEPEERGTSSPIGDREEEFEEEEQLRATVFDRGSTGRSPFLLVFLLILLVLVAGGAAVIFFAPHLIPDSLSFLKPVQSEEVPDMGARRLSFETVSSAFVESERVGPVFVIRGRVRNDYPQGRSFILVKGSILDDKGQAVKTELAYAGNALSDEEIKERPLEEINKTIKNRTGAEGKNVNVPPGESIPFVIVFENLPENLTEFTVEAISSSPGNE